MIEIKKAEIKSKMLATTITEPEYEDIKKIARKYGLSVSGYIRQLVSQQIKAEAKIANKTELSRN